MERRTFITGSLALAETNLLQSGGRRSRGPGPGRHHAGLRGRGGDHTAAYLQEPNVQIAAVCDVDESLLQRRIREIEAAGRPKPATYVDFRRLLEDKSIDAVSIATPNHHHALQAIWACEAGKDVYVEKPCSHHVIEEARPPGRGERAATTASCSTEPRIGRTRYWIARPLQQNPGWTDR